MLEATTLLFEAAGWRVTATCDGKEALDLIDGRRFDLVVLDLMLPSMNGRDVCAEVRRTSNLPISMLTAWDDQADLALDPGRFRVSRGGEPIELTATEFRLLLELAPSSGRVLVLATPRWMAWRIHHVA